MKQELKKKAASKVKNRSLKGVCKMSLFHHQKIALAKKQLVVGAKNAERGVKAGGWQK